MKVEREKCQYGRCSLLEKKGVIEITGAKNVSWGSMGDYFLGDGRKPTSKPYHQKRLAWGVLGKATDDVAY